MTLTICTGRPNPSPETGVVADLAAVPDARSRFICVIQASTDWRCAGVSGPLYFSNIESPSLAMISGAAVKLTFCSSPCTTCGATGSDTSASSWTVTCGPGASFQNRRALPNPFGRMTATGIEPFRTSASAAARSSRSPLPSAPACVATRSPPSAWSALTTCCEKSDRSSSTTATATRFVVLR
jgi:hypothetical protein